LLADWNKLSHTTTFKTGAQFKPGMKLCQHFFPNFWNIRNNKGVSFADCWKDRELMDKVRVWGKQGMSQLWLSWVRRAVFMAAGLPNSSFYRPHFSRQVILGTGKPTGTLFDPCAGWGGRLLGTVSTGWNYVACEPNVETFENLQRLVEFLGIEDKVTLLNIPAEEFDYKSLRSIDLVFTSPPYFDLEVYTDDTTQSYHKHNTFDIWVDNWLKPLIVNSSSMLSEDGLSCWNVMNFNKYDLAKRVVDIHTELNFTCDYTLGFQSPIANIRTVKNKDLTYVFSNK
jgi:16S rRNA G966 N2-methylase RsmD